MKQLVTLCTAALIALTACSKNSSTPQPDNPVLDLPSQKEANSENIVPRGDHTNIEMVLVPAGKFVRGSNKTDTEGLMERYGFTEPLFLDEHPQHTMTLAAFYIDKYEVSNIQFKEFILQTKRKLPWEWGHNGYGLTMEEAAGMDMTQLREIGSEHFKLDMDVSTMSRQDLMNEMQRAQKKRDPFPVTGIGWDYANAYCQWRSQRLPTEAEWEKAARGPDGNEFPWGDEWNPEQTNTGEDLEWEEGYAPVGSYPQNQSVYGALDMGGNVWEWTSTWYAPYEGSDYQSEFYGQKHRVIRGGGGGIGHYALSHFFRGASRQHADPRMASEDVGFRCAKDATAP